MHDVAGQLGPPPHSSQKIAGNLGPRSRCIAKLIDSQVHAGSVPNLVAAPPIVPMVDEQARSVDCVVRALAFTRIRKDSMRRITRSHR